MSTEEVRRAEARILARAFAPIDAVAFGGATGIVFGVGLFVACAWLLVRGGAIIGPTLGLLGQFLPGFSVTWPGAFIGLLYGLAIGFLFGACVAHFKNWQSSRFVEKARAAAAKGDSRKFLDYV
jgi:hypothetical protein